MGTEIPTLICDLWGELSELFYNTTWSNFKVFLLEAEFNSLQFLSLNVFNKCLLFGGIWEKPEIVKTNDEVF